uniref:Cation/H+ exchanger domain-containing protein n=1 Tax=Acrobeloides nanus TaxID=290746 RepID=A0A914DQM8_9BILA
MVSCTIEVIAIVFASHFILSMPLKTVIAFAIKFSSSYCTNNDFLARRKSCIVGSASWKKDNEKKTRPVEQAFRMLWNLGFQPFLFALIGLLFDVSQIDGKLLGTAFAIVLIALFVRILCVFIISFYSNFDFKEKVFVSFGFFPKATVQASLAPALFEYCTSDASCTNYSNKMLQICILSILITAPIGQLILQVLGRVLLRPKDSTISITTISNENSHTIQELEMIDSLDNSLHKTIVFVN